MLTGAELIAKERARHVSKEDWSSSHDDEQKEGELALAACCYASPVKLYVQNNLANSIHFDDPWPWSGVWDKRYCYGNSREGAPDEGANFVPSPETYDCNERLDLLVKAGSLIAAEIDRLIRELTKYELEETEKRRVWAMENGNSK